MAVAQLKIGGRVVSVIACLDLDQRVDPLGGSNFRRMANGAGFKLSHWRKHRITLSASGWVPAALERLAWEGPLAVELPYPLALAVGETLPPGWVSRGETTVTDQSGASVRLVDVTVTVFSDGPTQTANRGATPGWELVMETA